MPSFIRFELEARTSTDTEPTQIVPLLPVVDHALDGGDASKFGASESLSIDSEADGKWHRTEGNSWNVYCYDSSGAVRCRDGGKELWGSGAAIGKNLVLTAGHVVHRGDGGRPYGPIWFMPGFPNKTRRYYATHAYVAPGWVKGASFTDDVAVLVLEEDMDILGYSGVVADIPLHTDPRVLGKYLSWFTIAYPARPPFNGDDQIVDGGNPSSWAFREGTLYFQAELEAMKGFDLNQGASGGPWFISRAKVPHRRILHGHAPTHGAPGAYDVNGVNSFIRSDKRGVIYSPHFGGRVTRFLVDALADISLSGLSAGLSIPDE